MRCSFWRPSTGAWSGCPWLLPQCRCHARYQYHHWSAAGCMQAAGCLCHDAPRMLLLFQRRLGHGVLLPAASLGALVVPACGCMCSVLPAPGWAAAGCPHTQPDDKVRCSNLVLAGLSLLAGMSCCFVCEAACLECSHAGLLVGRPRLMWGTLSVCQAAQSDLVAIVPPLIGGCAHGPRCSAPAAHRAAARPGLRRGWPEGADAFCSPPRSRVPAPTPRFLRLP